MNGQPETLTLAIVSGLLAGSASFIANQYLWRFFRQFALVVAGPAVEESLKTGLAFLSGAPIWLCHLTFGLLEGSYDFYHSPLSAVKRWQAFGGSVAAHGSFGLVAGGVLIGTQNVGLAIGIGFVLHMAVNFLIVWWNTESR